MYVRPHRLSVLWGADESKIRCAHDECMGVGAVPWIHYKSVLHKFPSSWRLPCFSVVQGKTSSHVAASPFLCSKCVIGCRLCATHLRKAKGVPARLVIHLQASTKSTTLSLVGRPISSRLMLNLPPFMGSSVARGNVGSAHGLHYSGGARFPSENSL